MATPTYSGPVDYAVFTAPRDALLGDALRLLLAQVDSGAIVLLDLEVIELDASGAPARIPLTSLGWSGDFDLSVFDGAESDVLDPDDLAQIAGELTAENRAIAVVYEDRSLSQVADEVARRGGALLWSGGIDLAELEQNVSSNEQDPA